MKSLEQMGKDAKAASYGLAQLDYDMKSRGLSAISDALVARCEEILAQNKKDVDALTAKGGTKALIDRLTLTAKRIADMADGIRQVRALPDPVGEVLGMVKRPNGLMIGKKRVPLGVVGIIYEARPNVTADAAALCLKTSNACILRGGSEAIHSNTIVVSVINDALASVGFPPCAVQLVEDTSRETANAMMRLNDYIDVLIPRGGKGLIKAVVNNATVPVIETGSGNCHVYIEASADIEMGVNIIRNAKVSRPAVCNAAETLLVDRTIAPAVLPRVQEALAPYQVELRGCAETAKILDGIVAATEEDYYTEYSDYILAVKVVAGIDEAVAHINQYNTGHSECIVTNNYTKANLFLDRVDAAAVYVNASTRFTDGFEFGFGAEIGISTQKLHARGPMGLNELTTTKYIIYGNGQVRE